MLAFGTGSALATHGDPQEKLTSADNARARAMLLRRADFGPGFRTSRDTSKDPDLYCKALDESDLTLTGEAESPDFERGLLFVSSYAQVYQSLADANASWKRGTSAAGERCEFDVLRRELAQEGVKLSSMRRIAVPRIAQRTVAYRLQASVTAQGTTVKFFVDVIALAQSRAHASLLFASAVAPVPRAEEIHLARIVTQRMSKAMRGS